MTPNSKERPYQPSWIDRFNNWVEKLPVRAWIFHVAFGIVLILVQMFFLWLDGGLQAEELLPVIIYNGLAVSYLLALIHLLDNQAATAMSSMRPMLDTTEQDFDHYKYRLSNMPFLAPLIAGLVVMEMEKESSLHKIDLCFDAVFAKFNQLIHDGDYAAAERLNGTIASLEIQHWRISAIPTWPWRSEIAQIALTAIALPLILMILQYFVLQALNR